MRDSNNPSKEQILSIKDKRHRVIIPLYIPNEVGYYKDSWKVFEICLSSLLKSCESPIAISIISNGSCKIVNDKLFNLFKDGLIDELIIEKETIGKVNSILKALRTANERFITIADADVLFVNGWEKAILDIFKNFPKAGAVCPVPVFRKHNNYTYNIWFDNLFSKKLKFTKVVNPEAMSKFANSLGWSYLEDKYKDVYLTLQATNGLKAMVGCSHFVATYKREVFNDLPKNNTRYKLGGDSEGLYLDIPVLKYDSYRLSTVNNYAYHMGNTLEDWFITTYNQILEIPKKPINDTYPVLKKSKVKYVIKSKLFRRFLGLNPFKKWFYKSKGLSNKQLANFNIK
ncbi:glycosyltransferase family A protein [Algibacter pectinivorans]|uniref:Glycosyl transferase family 2 n=1 Tax=Algibacter pectinivorans TaxID=870482 RepID=A0A1I1P4L6_9FLAO|nr:glycosyltransferase family A protein [Algibacter pectinivorans]SFD02628.1 Glycosyl transferase family 2 [Algibacter pectinivorans]